MHRTRGRAAWWLVSAALGAWLLRSGWVLHLPVLCPFRRITGLPCPSCGMTRAMAALSHGAWDLAIACNVASPLVGALCAIGATLLLVQLVSGRDQLGALWNVRFVRRMVTTIVLVVLACAWVVNLSREGEGTAACVANPLAAQPSLQ